MPIPEKVSTYFTTHPAVPDGYNAVQTEYTGQAVEWSPPWTHQRCEGVLADCKFNTQVRMMPAGTLRPLHTSFRIHKSVFIWSLSLTRIVLLS